MADKRPGPRRLIALTAAASAGLALSAALQYAHENQVTARRAAAWMAAHPLTSVAALYAAGVLALISTLMCCSSGEHQEPL